MFEVKQERQELSLELEQVTERLKQTVLKKKQIEEMVSQLCAQMEERVTLLEQSEERDEGKENSTSLPVQPTMSVEKEQLSKMVEERDALEGQIASVKEQLEDVKRQRLLAEERAEMWSVEKDEALRKQDEAEKKVIDVMSNFELIAAEADRMHKELSKVQEQQDERGRNGDVLSNLLAEAEQKMRESNARAEIEGARSRHLEQERDELAAKAERLAGELTAAIEAGANGELVSLVSPSPDVARKSGQMNLEQRHLAENLQRKSEALEVTNRLLQSKISMVAVRARQQEVELSLAMADAVECSRELHNDFTSLQSKCLSLQIRHSDNTEHKLKEELQTLRQNTNEEIQVHEIEVQPYCLLSTMYCILARALFK